jgi:hypothetical protein
VSVQWGLGNYADRNGQRIGVETDDGHDSARKSEEWTADNAEVAVWQDRKADWLNLGSDTVAGWVAPEQIASLLVAVSAFGRDTDHDRASIIVQRALATADAA